MVAFDNTILSLLIFPDAELQQGSEGQKVERARERVLGLVRKIEEARDQIIVPAPALSDLLVTAGADIQDVLTTLRASAYIRIESFDELAAVELAMRLREARKAGDQREGLPISRNALRVSTWARSRRPNERGRHLAIGQMSSVSRPVEAVPRHS